MDEIRNLRVEHAIPAIEARGMWIHVARAKNDKYGRGNRTFIPSISYAGDRSSDPIAVIGSYLAALHSWGDWMNTYGGKNLGLWNKRALFPILRGPNAGNVISDRSAREDLKVMLAEQGHSNVPTVLWNYLHFQNS